MQALDLVYDRRRDGFDPLQAFIALFKDAEAAGPAKREAKTLTLEEQLRAHIIDGEKEGLTATLEAAMQRYKPLDIINDHLLDGMKTVGDLFGSGQMQLPFVLQSAEVMKMAVSHLEPHMDRVQGSTKGKIVLATVKGDVHDIGKNLVDIILTNNGYTGHQPRHQAADLRHRQGLARAQRGCDRHERPPGQVRERDGGEPQGAQRAGPYSARHPRRRGPHPPLLREPPPKHLQRARASTAKMPSTGCAPWTSGRGAQVRRTVA
jgi:hypothetical protein